MGLELSARDIRNGQLEPAVRAITSTDWVLDRVRQLAGDFAALGGPPRAAELIARVAAGE